MKKERGITLLALAITIIVLIILTAVTINGLTGEEGILTSTTTATKNYTIAEYKEKLEESVQQTIIEKAVLGEEATLDSLRENIASIDTSMQTISMGDSISDVIVKTEEGYLFQVYFDELLSEYHVEYMGNADTSYIPKVTYTESAGTIEVNATSGNISKMTISLNGTELGSTDTSTLSYTATTSGTYVVTIETTEGLTRYAYINVTFAKDNIYAPTITAVATDSSEATNGWYKTSVYLTIDGTSTNGTTLKYKLIGATTQVETPITDLTSATVLTISNAGLTKAIAWVEYEETDSNGNTTTYKSDYSYYNIKIDNIAPVIDVDRITISGTEGSNSWYISDVVISFSSAITDANSGIAGYYYYKEGDETNKSDLIDINRTLTISTDGEINLVIQGVDKAGNESTKSTIEIKKDSTAPQDFMPTITASGTTGFTIVCGTVDLTSGIDYYEYYVGSTKVGSNDTGTLEVTDYSVSDLYTIYAVAVDKAGNSKISSSTTTYSVSSSSGGSTSTGTLYTWDVYSVTSTVAYSVVESNEIGSLILGFQGIYGSCRVFCAYTTEEVLTGEGLTGLNWLGCISLVAPNCNQSSNAHAMNCLCKCLLNKLVVACRAPFGFITASSGNLVIKFTGVNSTVFATDDTVDAWCRSVGCYYFNVCYNYLYQLTETQTTNATQGTTLLGTATSYDSTAYPTDGFYNGYWYVLQT